MDEIDLNLLEVKPLVDVKVIKETLSRLGIANKKERILYPSCYLIESEDIESTDVGGFYLCHFKQLFGLFRDKSYNNICEEDIVRRNAIAYCLKQWKLIDVEDSLIDPHNKYIFVLPHSEKESWNIKHKFKFFRKQEEEQNAI